MYWLALLPIVVGDDRRAPRRVPALGGLGDLACSPCSSRSAGSRVKASGAFAAGTGPFANLAFGAALVFLLEVGVLLWTAKEPAGRR